MNKIEFAFNVLSNGTKPKLCIDKTRSIDSIQDAMLKRARWVWQSIEEFAKQKETILHKRYVSGETQFYLGKRYVLKVVVDSEAIPNVKLSRGKLNVTAKLKLFFMNDYLSYYQKHHGSKVIHHFE